jgi:hypothetical protein
MGSVARSKSSTGRYDIRDCVMRSRLAVVEEDLSQPRRWELADLDDWLLGRLNHRWGDLSWRGKLAGFSANNDFLFITNEDAVLLATAWRDPLTNKQFVMERFAFAREADVKNDVYNVAVGSHGEAAIHALHLHMAGWGKAMGANRVYMGICCDILPSTLRQMTPDSYYVVGAAC